MAVQIVRIKNLINATDISNKYQSNSVSIEKSGNEYKIRFYLTTKPFMRFETIYIINNLGSTKLVDTDGNPIDFNLKFTVESVNTMNDATIDAVSVFTSEGFKITTGDFFKDQDTTIRMFVNDLISKTTSLIQYRSNGISIHIFDPKSVLINNTLVTDAFINNKRIKTISMDGHIYTFPKHIVITGADINSFLDDHIIWVNGVGSISTNIPLKGLHLSYSKHTGLVRGDKIDIFVMFDYKVVELLNGGTDDLEFDNVTIGNHNILITEQDVKDYLDTHITWSGTSGNLDVRGWPNLHPETKLYTPNLHIVDGTDVVYTVQTNSLHTVNGVASVDYTINTTRGRDIYIGTYGEGLKKLVNGALIDVDDASNDVSFGFIYQVSDGTIYVGMNNKGLMKLENDKLILIDTTDAAHGFMYQTKDGTIYFGTYSQGLKKLVNGKLVDFDNTNVNSGFMLQTSDGTIYVGTHSNGIKKLENGTLVDFDNTDVGEGFINQVEDGTVYVGIYNKGITKIQNNVLVTVDDSSSVINGFMYQVEDGTIYVKTTDNLCILENGKLNIVVKYDLDNAFMYQTSDKTIYVGASNGIKKLENGALVDFNPTNVQGGFMIEVFK